MKYAQEAERRVENEPLKSVVFSLLAINRTMEDVNASIMETGGDGSYLDKIETVLRDISTDITDIGS